MGKKKLKQIAYNPKPCEASPFRAGLRRATVRRILLTLQKKHGL